MKILFYGFLFLFIIFFFPSCKTYQTNSTHKNVSQKSIKKGAELATIFCQSCHMLPDPSLLDSKTWENGVLPEMGPRLGVFNYGFKKYPRSYDANIGANYYPSVAVLTLNDWKNILDYYESTSPDSLAHQNRKEAVKTDLALFKMQIPKVNYANSATSYIHILQKDSSQIIVGDAIKDNLYFINYKSGNIDSIATGGPIVDIDFNKNNFNACNIGILNPNNGKFGKIEEFNFSSTLQLKKDSIPLIDSLQRPVQITAVDLNNDQKTDYLICEFGYLTGGLSWFENLGNGHFKKHYLRNVPGAIKAYVTDYNHDGLPDLWVLFAQGDESIFLFTNMGNGNFQQEQVLRFPPVYGSSYFELDDFNKDGYMDILYTSGDNADYSTILKPYHGVYIFMNDHTNHFNQKFFFPIHGCYKAIARDFDGDGDLDIATISFFADYEKQPEESFVYLENKGNLNFTASTFPGSNLGRWITMDAGDLDGDGKIDLVLGNFSIGPVLMPHKIDWKKSPPFIILKNIGK